jgi:sugar phosphate isomerase/epimerase
MKKLAIILAYNLCGLLMMAQPSVTWQHLSSKNPGSGLEAPNAGDQQTSAAIADFNNDGINDFCISERTKAPALVWYERQANGWKRQVVEDEILFIEAGTTAADIDGDGDLDIIAGGEGKSNQVWWWENPFPDFSSTNGWNRYLIRNSGKNKIHDQMVGDFDGDGKTDLVFWAQGDNTLYFTRIPSNPKELSAWKLIPVYTYFNDGQMEQYGEYPSFKKTNEHEGLAKADINGDGIQDIIGGGLWFGYLGEDKFSFNTIDGAYTFSRSEVGQFIKGGRPEVLLVIGDGWAPLYLYEYRDKTWMKKTIIDKVSNGHSLSAIDFDGDGNLDIWNAEMTLFENTKAVNHILLGDGKGNFPHEIKISEGIDIHESEMADLDGDGDYDVLGKPYNGNAPRVDVWLQNGTGELISARKGAFNHSFGLQLYSMRFEFKKDVPGTLAKVKTMGINEVEVSGYYGFTAKEFKKLLDQKGLKCGSMIFGYDQFEKNIETVIKDAKLFGAKYVGIGWIPHQKPFGKTHAEKAILDFNLFGEKLKKAGLRFFYHPHGYEFNTPDGNMLDLMLSQTKPELVTFQLDVFWTTHGGADPLAYLKNYPGRFELMHLKELRKDTPGNNSGGAADETSVSLGKGVTNWPIMLRQAVKSGTKKFYIEDEAKNAIDQIPATIDFLNSLK